MRRLFLRTLVRGRRLIRKRPARLTLIAAGVALAHAALVWSLGLIPPRAFEPPELIPVELVSADDPGAQLAARRLREAYANALARPQGAGLRSPEAVGRRAPSGVQLQTRTPDTLSRTDLLARDSQGNLLAPYNPGTPGAPTRYAPYREGYAPGVALTRVVRSLDCLNADKRDPRILEICAGVLPPDLLPEGRIPDLIIRDAEFEAIVRARELRANGIATPLDMQEERPGCVAGIASPDC